MKNFKQYLTEKQILYSNDARYGTVIFLAGGAASGKGYARENFMDSHKFKIRDVDEWKLSFQKLSTLKNKYPEIRNLNLKNPDDVFKLHEFVKKFKIKDKTLDLLLNNHAKDRLPNIMFDVTLKDTGDIEEVMPALLAAGYKKENIHITWILTDYHLAVKANQDRKRVVPSDILLKTHEGAAETMHSILNGNVPDGVDGDINVVLNNHNQTIRYSESPNVAEKHTKKLKDGKKADFNIAGFTYMTVKRQGRPIAKAKDIRGKLFSWIKDNIPKDSELHKQMEAGQHYIDGAKDGLMKAGVPTQQPIDNDMDNNGQNDRNGQFVDRNRSMGNSSMNKSGNQSFGHKRPGKPETGKKDSGLVTIHRRHGGKIGFAFKTAGKRIGFTPQEADEKIKNLKKMFPTDEFVTIPYSPRQQTANM
jgi:hypothetical protein